MKSSSAPLVCSCCLAAALLVAAGCSNRLTVPRLQPEEVAQFQAAGNFPTTEYQLETGDTLDIRFPFHPEMNQQELVRPDGKISAKIVGEIEVAGLTASQVEKLLKERTSSNLRDPEVAVTVAQYAPKSVYVTGEVGTPGLVEFRPGLTPLQAVVEAGGFKDTALVDYVILIRSGGGDRIVSRALDLRQVVTKGAGEPLDLAPHDVVYVPKTRIADTDLWIDQHVTRLFPFIRGAATSFPMGF